MNLKKCNLCFVGIFRGVLEGVLNLCFVEGACQVH